MSRDIFDAMNKFIDSTAEPMNDIDYFETEEAYARLFGHGVPTEMLPPSATREKIIETMKSCIDTRRDDLLHLLNTSVNTEFKY
jgi:hypothetical protein